MPTYRPAWPQRTPSTSFRHQPSTVCTSARRRTNWCGPSHRDPHPASWFPQAGTCCKEAVMRLYCALAVPLALSVLAAPAAAQGKLERLYVIDCGERTAPDVAPWTPG